MLGVSEDDGIKVEYSIDRIRLMGRLIRASKGIPYFTSEQAKSFILLHGQELQDRLDKIVRDFMEDKL